MADDSPEMIPADFVFAGMRMLSDHTLGCEVYIITEDGGIGRKMLFSAKQFRGRVIGSKYRGASFSENTVQGLAAVDFCGQLDDREKRIEWETKDRSAKVADKARKLEKGAAKHGGEIDRLMRPIRELFHGMRQRGDYALASAFEQAVIASLHKPPPKESK